MLLLTALQACAHRPVEVPVAHDVPVAVPVKDVPPSELTRCSDRPEGLPEDKDLIAQIPTRARAGVIRIARAFSGNASQLDRLINWIAPGSCPAAQ